MSLEPLKTLRAETLILRQANIDTDQIIPARFLTTTEREGLGRFAFYDWRFDSDGNPKASNPFPEPNAGAQKILVAGPNFGCGSSREHAPWALLDYGFRAVVSSDIADIFTSNSLKNGLLPVVVDEGMHRHLLERGELEVTIDLESQTVTAGNRSATFAVEPFARRCLLDGNDPLGHLLAHDDAIVKYEEKRVAA